MRPCLQDKCTDPQKAPDDQEPFFWINFSVASVLEFEVHADQNVLGICFDVDAAAANTSASIGPGPATRAEVHVIVFQENRPLRNEHPFDTTADRPAGRVVRDLRHLRTGRIAYGVIPLRPGHATLRIEQHVRLHEVATASRQGIEPVRVTVLE